MQNRGRPKKYDFTLSSSELEKIKSAINTDKKQNQRAVLRAKVLLSLHEGLSPEAVSEKLGVNKSSIYRLVKRHKETGINVLTDAPRSGRPGLFSENEKNYVRKLALLPPYKVDSTLTADLWSLESLQSWICANCQKQGFAKLKGISVSEISSIIDKTELKVKIQKNNAIKGRNKINVAPILYKRLEFYVSTRTDYYTHKTDIIISYDDTSYEDLQKKTRQYNKYGQIYIPSIQSDILSCQMGINLLTGKVIALTKFSHSNNDFLEFLDLLQNDNYDNHKINLILDKHRLHTSDQTIQYLSKTKIPIKLIFEPKSSFWINLFEMFLSKLVRIRLNRICISTDEELLQKINDFIKELNACPSGRRWPDDIASLRALTE